MALAILFQLASKAHLGGTRDQPADGCTDDKTDGEYDEDGGIDGHQYDMDAGSPTRRHH
jgi:hypothetical protein